MALNFDKEQSVERIDIRANRHKYRQGIGSDGAS